MAHVRAATPYETSKYGNMPHFNPGIDRRQFSKLADGIGSVAPSGLVSDAKKYSRALKLAAYLGLSTLMAACGSVSPISPSSTTPSTPNATAKGSLVNKLDNTTCYGGHANFAGATGNSVEDGSFEVKGIMASADGNTEINAVFTPSNCLPITAKYNVKPGVNNFPALNSVSNNVDGIAVDVERLREYDSHGRGGISLRDVIVLWSNPPIVEVYKDTFNDQARYARALKGYIDNAVRKAFAELVTGSEIPNYQIIEKSGNPPLWGRNEINDVNQLPDGLLIIQGPSGRIPSGAGGETQYKSSGYLIKSARVFLSDQVGDTIAYAEIANAGSISDLTSGPPGVTNKSNRYDGNGSLSPHDKAYNRIRRALGPGVRFTERKLDITELGIIRPIDVAPLPASTESTDRSVNHPQLEMLNGIKTH